MIGNSTDSERLAAALRKLEQVEAAYIALESQLDRYRWRRVEEEMRSKIKPPPCPETQAACDRMCLTMCHRRSEELSELRKDRERLDWVLLNCLVIRVGFLSKSYVKVAVGKVNIDAAMKGEG